MKKHTLTSLVLVCLPWLVQAQEQGLDERIDAAFGQATGWFVNFIFYQIPITDEIRVFWVLFP